MVAAFTEIRGTGLVVIEKLFTSSPQPLVKVNVKIPLVFVVSVGLCKEEEKPAGPVQL